MDIVFKKTEEKENNIYRALEIDESREQSIKSTIKKLIDDYEELSEIIKAVVAIGKIDGKTATDTEKALILITTGRAIQHFAECHGHDHNKSVEEMPEEIREMLEKIGRRLN